MPSIFGPRHAYTIFAAFPTLRAPTPCHARAVHLVIPSSFVEDKKIQVVGGRCELYRCEAIVEHATK